MTQPTRLICQPWASLADLEAWPNRPQLDDDTWEDLLWMASEMLYLWSGKQYSGGCRSTVELKFRERPAWDCMTVRHSVMGFAPGSVRHQVVARLPDAPVTGIESVIAPDGTEYVRGVDFTANYSTGIIEKISGNWVGGTTATYTHGLLPPIGGMRAVIALTVELGKLWTGGKCNLPKRVESISREGITIGLVSSLQGWRTGLWDIDAWLASANPHMMPKRASAWSPDVPYARRITT
jgi:hypothetical protein